MTTEQPEVNTDVDTLVSDPKPLELSTGRVVQIERLKTRQTFRLLKVLTRGAGPLITELGLDVGDSESDFTGKLIAAVIISIPEAEDEAVDFLLSMCRPEGLIEKPRTKADRQHNDEIYEEFYEEFSNPELEDTIAIIEAIIRVEAPHIQSLGKRLTTLLKVESQSKTAKRTASSKKPSKG